MSLFRYLLLLRRRLTRVPNQSVSSRPKSYADDPALVA